MDIKLVNQWFSLAEADIDSAKLLKEMRPQHREIICYHCQQAAEKYLKGFLQANGMMPPKTHELTTLCKLCIEKDRRFNEITGVCLFLTQFAIQPKYPHEMNINGTTYQTSHIRYRNNQKFCPNRGIETGIDNQPILAAIRFLS